MSSWRACARPSPSPKITLQPMTTAAPGFNVLNPDANEVYWQS
jgi:hypothetical protein